MNLQPYRQSFYINVADSDLERGRNLTNQLADAGYNCEQRLTPQSLTENIIKQPPHIILFYYDDALFITDKNQYQNFIESILKKIPEVHIIFLAPKDKLADVCALYEYGAYDVLAWPLEHPMQLLRSVDRAAENDFYMYLNEQLREKLGDNEIKPDENHALFELWLKEIDKTTSKEELIKMWMKEAARVHQSQKAIFFRYIDSKKTLVASEAIGLSQEDIFGVGLDLISEEPGFESAMLKHPEQMRTLIDFTLRGLQADQAAYYYIEYKEQILGVVVIPMPKGAPVAEHKLKNPYLVACLSVMRRQMDFLDIKSRLQKFSIYDEVSEALTAEIIIQKVREEISRSRRLTRPVALLLIAIDNLAELSLSQTKDNIQLLLKATAEILRKNSRLNDLVGRVAPDQFALCLPHTEKKGAAIKAERLRRMIGSADFTAILGPSAKLTVSIGVAEYPTVCQDSESLFKQAENALIEIRKTGFNRCQVAVAPPRFVPDFVVNDEKSSAINTR